MKIRRTAHH